MTGDIESSSEQFKIDSHFADFKQVKIDPNYLFLLTLSRSAISGLPFFFFSEILGVLGEFRRKINLFLGEI